MKLGEVNPHLLAQNLKIRTLVGRGERREAASRNQRIQLIITADMHHASGASLLADGTVRRRVPVRVRESISSSRRRGALAR